jgi:tRNA pseudouridine13 synthase
VTLVPHVPPFFTADLEGTGGAIGPDPEDFLVEEIPAYLPSGEGDHFYVKLRKRGATTRDAALALSRAAKVSERDVGYAGMKDKHGVTTQWLSVPVSAVPAQHYELPPEFSILEISRHTNKLRTGHLRGNRFRIGLTGTLPGSDERARALLARLSERGHVNHFGTQRFGRDGRNLVDGVAWLSGKQRLPRGRERFLSKLYASAVQSEVFNRYATRRVALGLDHLIEGEVMRLAGAGASFVVEDVERETPRLLAKDLCFTGPMPGPKIRAAAGAAAALEAEVLAEIGLEPPALHELGRHAPGTRRDLLVMPERVEVSSVGDRLWVAFELPSGSYATMVVRELTRGAAPDVRGEV